MGCGFPLKTRIHFRYWVQVVRPGKGANRFHSLPDPRRHTRFGPTEPNPTQLGPLTSTQLSQLNRVGLSNSVLSNTSTTIFRSSFLARSESDSSFVWSMSIGSEQTPEDTGRISQLLGNRSGFYKSLFGATTWYRCFFNHLCVLSNLTLHFCHILHISCVLVVIGSCICPC